MRGGPFAGPLLSNRPQRKVLPRKSLARKGESKKEEKKKSGCVGKINILVRWGFVSNIKGGRGDTSKYCTIVSEDQLIFLLLTYCCVGSKRKTYICTPPIRKHPLPPIIAPLKKNLKIHFCSIPHYQTLIHTNTPNQPNYIMRG